MTRVNASGLTETRILRLPSIRDLPAVPLSLKLRSLDRTDYRVEGEPNVGYWETILEGEVKNLRQAEENPVCGDYYRRSAIGSAQKPFGRLKLFPARQTPAPP